MDNIRIIHLDGNKIDKVASVSHGYIFGDNDLESELGELGQIMQEDGSFIDAPITPAEIKPTIDEQMEQLRQDNLIIMDVLATMYEDMLAKGTV